MVSKTDWARVSDIETAGEHVAKHCRDVFVGIRGVEIESSGEPFDSDSETGDDLARLIAGRELVPVERAAGTAVGV